MSKEALAHDILPVSNDETSSSRMLTLPQIPHLESKAWSPYYRAIEHGRRVLYDDFDRFTQQLPRKNLEEDIRNRFSDFGTIAECDPSGHELPAIRAR